MNNNNQNNDPNKKKNLKSALIMLVICLGLTVLFSTVMNRYRNGEQEKITYDEFVDMLDKKEIKSVTLTDSRVLIEPKKQENPLVKTVYYTVVFPDSELTNRLLAADIHFEKQDDSGSSLITQVVVGWLLPCHDVLCDARYRKGRRHDGRCRQEQRQGICGEKDRRHICGCGGTG